MVEKSVEIIIDASNLILGRLASAAAKMALENKNVVIVNCEKCVITGSEKHILERYKKKRKMGDYTHGPFFPRMPDKIVRRAVRGMVNYKSDRGAKAFKRVRAYIGVPNEYQGKEITTIESADIKKVKSAKFITMERISKELGAKW